MNLPTSHDAPRLEPAPCPLGCPPGDDAVLEGRDRLHGLPGSFTVVRCRTLRSDADEPPTVAFPDGLLLPERLRPSPRYARDSAANPIAFVVFAKAEEQEAPAQYDPLNRAIPPLAPARMLEIGCGAGRFLQEMADQGW